MNPIKPVVIITHWINLRMKTDKGCCNPLDLLKDDRLKSL